MPKTKKPLSELPDKIKYCWATDKEVYAKARTLAENDDRPVNYILDKLVIREYEKKYR